MYFNSARCIVHISIPFPYSLFLPPPVKMISTTFLLATTLSALLGPILPVRARSLDVPETTDPSLTKRGKMRGREIYFEVELQQGFAEGTSRDPSLDIIPARTAIWIDEHRMGGAALKIDMRLVEYNPGVFLFTPFVQEIDFPFPHLPPILRDHTAVSIRPGVEMFPTGKAWFNNLDVMDFRTGKGFVLDIIKGDPMLSSTERDPNVFLFQLLFYLLGNDNEPQIPLVVSRIEQSREYYRSKNPSFVSLIPLVAYQAGPHGRYRRWFNVQNIEQPVNVAEDEVAMSLISVSGMIVPVSLNPYIPVWGTVTMESSARPP